MLCDVVMLCMLVCVCACMRVCAVLYPDTGVIHSPSSSGTTSTGGGEGGGMAKDDHTCTCEHILLNGFMRCGVKQTTLHHRTTELKY